ncbi:2579_t:CDS:2 [Paraglomus occultum]|uniref:2579_t:CDS:1 n=1 Tax=Paraglomus occultum TaxID=144539 RepID=A0A9N9BSG9_9GLOM|nr:2579_t:CDS:2 [Paraglomus occultum]
MVDWNVDNLIASEAISPFQRVLPKDVVESKRKASRRPARQRKASVKARETAEPYLLKRGIIIIVESFYADVERDDLEDAITMDLEDV